MTTANLSCDQKNHVLRRVYRRLRGMEPQLFQSGEPWRPGGAFELREYVEALAESALLSPRQREAQVRDRVCSNCYHRTPCGYCPFRAGCVFNRHNALIMDAVAQAVRDLRLHTRNENEDGGHDAGDATCERS